MFFIPTIMNEFVYFFQLSIIKIAYSRMTLNMVLVVSQLICFINEMHRMIYMNNCKIRAKLKKKRKFYDDYVKNRLRM